MDYLPLILVVDDEPAMREIITRHLKKAGFNTIEASHGEEALIQIHKLPPDMIVSDVRMPIMDGFELFRVLQKNTGDRRIPFVFLTELSEIKHRLRGLEMGVDDYIAKPFNPPELILKVKNLCRKQDIIRESSASHKELSGALADFHMVDLIQMVGISNQSAEVRVTVDDKQGALYFENGRIIDAEFDEESGLAACYRMIANREGTFRVKFVPVTRSTTIDKPNDAIILDAMYRLDTSLREAEAKTEPTTANDSDVASVPNEPDPAPDPPPLPVPDLQPLPVPDVVSIEPSAEKIPTPSRLKPGMTVVFAFFAVLMIGMLFFQNRDSRDATAPGETTVKPTGTDRIIFTEAVDLYARGEYEKALNIFSQLAADYPDNPVYQEYREKSESNLQRISEEKRRQSILETLSNKATASFSAGDFDGARKIVEEILKVNDQYAPALALKLKLVERQQAASRPEPKKSRKPTAKPSPAPTPTRLPTPEPTVTPVVLDTGTLLVSSVPSGTVFIAGEQKGSTPMRIRDMETGEHELVIRAVGYREYVSRITIEKDRKTTITAHLEKIVED